MLLPPSPQPRSGLSLPKDHPGFIDEDMAARVDPAAMMDPSPASPRDRSR
jgi:hypothetical protein